MELPPHHLSATLVPAMAFDRSGGRLGRGAGYYDELPTEPHDVPMTHVVTESSVLTFDEPDPWSVDRT